MTRIASVPVAVLVFALLSAPASAATSRCGPKTASTLAGSKYLRVFKAPGGVFGPHAVVCSRRYNSRWRIGTAKRCGQEGGNCLSHLRVRGTYVAHVDHFSSEDYPDSYFILALQTASGAIVDHLQVGEPAVEAVTPRQLILDRRGIGLIGYDTYYGERRIITIGNCARELVADDPTIDFDSIRLRGYDVSWTTAAGPQTKRICGYAPPA
jgi:hypothetical protein